MICNCKTQCNLCRCGMAEGERRKADAIGLLAAHRESAIRRIQRAFLDSLLSKGETTTDAVSDATPLEVRKNCVGAAVNHLAKAKLISFVCFAISTRPDRHACPVRVWRLGDRGEVLQWLAAHPDLPDPDKSEGAAASQRVLFPVNQETATPTGEAAGAAM